MSSMNSESLHVDSSTSAYTFLGCCSKGSCWRYSSLLSVEHTGLDSPAATCILRVLQIAKQNLLWEVYPMLLEILLV